MPGLYQPVLAVPKPHTELQVIEGDNVASHSLPHFDIQSCIAPVQDLSKPCPKIDTERQKKEKAWAAAGNGANGGGLFSFLRALTPGKAGR